MVYSVACGVLCLSSEEIKKSSYSVEATILIPRVQVKTYLVDCKCKASKTEIDKETKIVSGNRASAVPVYARPIWNRQVCKLKLLYLIFRYCNAFQTLDRFIMYPISSYNLVLGAISLISYQQSFNEIYCSLLSVLWTQIQKHYFVIYKHY